MDSLTFVDSVISCGLIRTWTTAALFDVHRSRLIDVLNVMRQVEKMQQQEFKEWYDELMEK